MGKVLYCREVGMDCKKVSAHLEALASTFQQRCPIYTTLARSAPIDLQVKRSQP